MFLVTAGLRLSHVPAKRIPDLLAEAVSNGNIEIELLKTLIAKYSNISEESLPDDYVFWKLKVLMTITA